MAPATISAAQAGLVSCEACHLLSRPADPAEPGYCPRCGGELVWRRPHAIQYAWAFLIAAAVCYIPANLLPVLRTSTVTGTEPDTIMSGVVFLYTSGSWPLALVVLIASVMIPLGKLIALAYLLITVQRGSIRGNRDRSRLYRMVEIIGRWSMRFATTRAPTQTSAPVCQPNSTTAETAKTTPSETPRVSIPSTGTGWRSAIRTTTKSVAMPTRSAVSRAVVANP